MAGAVTEFIWIYGMLEVQNYEYHKSKYRWRKGI